MNIYQSFLLIMSLFGPFAMLFASNCAGGGASAQAQPSTFVAWSNHPFGSWHSLPPHESVVGRNGQIIKYELMLFPEVRRSVIKEMKREVEYGDNDYQKALRSLKVGDVNLLVYLRKYNLRLAEENDIYETFKELEQTSQKRFEKLDEKLKNGPPLTTLERQEYCERLNRLTKKKRAGGESLAI